MFSLESWNVDGKPVDPAYLAKVKPILTPYGPDDDGPPLLAR
jgi:hypothetical protein